MNSNAYLDRCTDGGEGTKYMSEEGEDGPAGIGGKRHICFAIFELQTGELYMKHV